MKRYIQIALAAILVLQTACSDFLTGEDSKYTSEEQLADILERNPDAIILGVYSRSIQYAFNRSQHDDFGQKSLDISVDISAQDMVHLNMTSWFRKSYWMEDRTAITDRPKRQWSYCYANIRDLNDFLALVPKEQLSELSEELKQMRGEALALRAYHYFMLINLFQTGGTWDNIKDLPGVPVYTVSTLEGNGRGTVSDVYSRILEDYEEAIELLQDVKYDTPTRIGEVAAKLLAARAYLYAGNYHRALELSSDVVAASGFMTLDQYVGGFDDINNPEWLLGIDVTATNTTNYASFFSQYDPDLPGYGGALQAYKCIDAKLYLSFNEANDIRLANFNSSTVFVDAEKDVPYLQYKFQDKSGKFLGDLIYLRNAEAWYIKAESQVRTGDIPGAHQTLDQISDARAIDGKHTYVWSASTNELIDQIFVHKRMELWGEGHNAFEFNRMEKPIDRTYEGSNHPTGNILDGERILEWNDRLRILQIPIAELEGNTNISNADQNP